MSPWLTNLGERAFTWGGRHPWALAGGVIGAETIGTPVAGYIKGRYMTGEEGETAIGIGVAKGALFGSLGGGFIQRAVGMGKGGWKGALIGAGVGAVAFPLISAGEKWAAREYPDAFMNVATYGPMAVGGAVGLGFGINTFARKAIARKFFAQRPPHVDSAKFKRMWGQVWRKGGQAAAEKWGEGAIKARKEIGRGAAWIRGSFVAQRYAISAAAPIAGVATGLALRAGLKENTNLKTNRGYRTIPRAVW